MSDDTTYSGQMGAGNTVGEFNQIRFLIYQFLGTVRTCTIAKVMAVQNTGGVEAVGFVDVMPLVNLADGVGTVVKHSTIFQLPYFRLQGGSNALIIDPQVGDIGIVVFADRDISAVKASKGQANPGSRRRFDWADGIYVGGVLNGVPEQYIQFNAAGLTITDKNGNVAAFTNTGIKFTDLNGHVIEMKSTGISMTGDLTVSGNIVGNSHHLSTHVHSGVTTGSGNSGGPVG
jgi:hypothetical protein